MPTVPDAVDGLVIVGGRPAMVIVKDKGELVPEAFVPVMLIVVVPAAVGVPVIAPVDVLKVKPAGSAPDSAKLVAAGLAVVL